MGKCLGARFFMAHCVVIVNTSQFLTSLAPNSVGLWTFQPQGKVDQRDFDTGVVGLN